MFPSVKSACLGAAALAAAVYADGTACNNSPELCGRAYNNITYMGAHDSAFLRNTANDNSVSGNQYLNATQALSAGLRFLQTQVHNLNGTLELCHTSCELLDAGPLEAWLTDISYWMSQNPNDVVTILLVNSDNQPVTDFGNAYEQSGLAQYGYHQAHGSATSNWPTLQTMINSGQRLVTFITNIQSSTAYAYIRDEFDYVFETAYDILYLDGFNCTLNRPGGIGTASDAVSKGYLSLLNHFKDTSLSADVIVPDVSNIDTVNSPTTNSTASVGYQIEECTTQYGVKPNFILVDFWNAADPLQAADTANGLTEDQITGRSTPGSSTSSAIEVTSNLGRGALLAALTGVFLLV